MTLAALHVTKCRLCGQPPAGPEGLCSDCSRALARARDGLAGSRAGAANAARRQRMVERIVLTSPVDPEPARSPKKAGAALWATLGVVAVVIVLVATANLTPQRPVELKASERPARVVTQLLEPATEGDSAEAGAAVSSPQAASEPPSLPKVAAPAPRPARAQGTRAAADGKPASDASRVGAAAEPAPQSEPPVQQARVNVASGPASVDDGQSLAAMLERCSEEKFLAGVICEQKVRLRYCEGKWGQVPQCTKKPHVD